MPDRWGAMAGFTVRIYRRRRPNETAGELTEVVSLEARNSDAAEREALLYLERINWETHFAGLLDDDKAFVRIWAGEGI